MIDLFLKPGVFEGLLILGAILTPSLYFGLRHRFPDFARTAKVCAFVGPALLVYWFFYLLLQSTLGFASIWVAVILFIISITSGVLAGRFARQDKAFQQTDSSPND